MGRYREKIWNSDPDVGASSTYSPLSSAVGGTDFGHDARARRLPARLWQTGAARAVERGAENRPRTVSTSVKSSSPQTELLELAAGDSRQRIAGQGAGRSGR